MLYQMSERESKFLNWLSGILGTFLVALVLGMVVFVRTYDRNDGIQSEKIQQLEKADEVIKVNIEIVRTEIRQDLKEIKMNIDKIAESQARNSSYYQTNQKN